MRRWADASAPGAGGVSAAPECRAAGSDQLLDMKEGNMAPSNDNVLATLNRLIETCKDGENGYRTAAKCVTNVDLKALFETYSQQRGVYASKLQGEVMGLGGSPEVHRSVAGPVWRAWTNLKSLLTGGSEHAVIAEVERGEDAAKESYQAALKQPLPPHVQALTERQFAGIREAHERIHALEAVTSH
jgi:uncharacterized protein (TIGR02284 family)